MWRYLRKAKNTKKCEKMLIFQLFWHFSEKWWHYVALCGAISGGPKTPKSVKKLIFSTFLQFSEKWWHYVALSPEGQKHQKVRKNCFFFSTFWQISEKWWHYAALSPEGQKHQKV